MQQYGAGNRLINEKMKAQNDRYHLKRLSQIKNSKYRQQRLLSVKLDNHKGVYQQQERKQQIQKQNAQLLSKMNRIMEKKSDFPKKPTSIRPKNFTDRSATADVQRLANVKSVYSQDKLDASWRENQKYMRSISKFRGSRPGGTSMHDNINRKSLTGEQTSHATPQSYTQYSHPNKKTANVNSAVLSIDNPLPEETNTNNNTQTNQPMTEAAELEIKNRRQFENAMKMFFNIDEPGLLKEGKNDKDHKFLQDKFNHPEEILQRVILLKKSVFIGDLNNPGTYLIEISTAYRMLFILCFDMTNLKNVWRLRFREDKAIQMLQDNNWNYNNLIPKISIDPKNGILIRRNIVRIVQNTSKELKQQPSQQQLLEDLRKERRKKEAARQAEFIKRNFYEVNKPMTAVSAVSATESLKPVEAAAHPATASAAGHGRKSGQNSGRQNASIPIEMRPPTSGVSIRRRFRFVVSDKQRRDELKRIRKLSHVPSGISEERIESDLANPQYKNQEEIKEEELEGSHRNTYMHASNSQQKYDGIQQRKQSSAGYEDDRFDDDQGGKQKQNTQSQDDYQKYGDNNNESEQQYDDQDFNKQEGQQDEEGQHEGEHQQKDQEEYYENQFSEAGQEGNHQKQDSQQYEEDFDGDNNYHLTEEQEPAGQQTKFGLQQKSKNNPKKKTEDEYQQYGEDEYYELSTSQIKK